MSYTTQKQPHNPEKPHPQRSTLGRLTKNKQNKSRSDGRVGLASSDWWGRLSAAVSLFFVTLPNLLVTPGGKSSQFSYSNLALPLLQSGINTLPKYFLLVEQLHFGRETKKQANKWYCAGVAACAGVHTQSCSKAASRGYYFLANNHETGEPQLLLPCR
ncbi:unnamed protein product [Meganyctiphanes norvegica]|uniref:Uncharacterized protein n=1 Tax=Meganyctiphanes norvegica TaxID=48144 RepID=A0AAV2SM76_MEGNR